MSSTDSHVLFFEVKESRPIPIRWCLTNKVNDPGPAKPPGFSSDMGTREAIPQLAVDQRHSDPILRSPPVDVPSPAVVLVSTPLGLLSDSRQKGNTMGTAAPLCSP